ncbi:MAG: hypothetical protein CVV28_02720 [Methanobacteriales archaeon HGW-Methanobacteriales-1]|jgi:hypothetical protein|nr:MAG: hypothetical protein CVV28_02720 [Methanobacteriales archaeon HGW-Methanobacteriales-1]
MVEDFEEKIEEIEKENMEIISDMDTLCKKFIEETKSFIKYYIDGSIAVTVKSQYDITNNLNKEQLRNLKENRNSLTNIIASKIDEEFKNPTYWTHAHEIPDHTTNQEFGYDNHNKKFLKLKEIINSFDNYPQELITQYGYTNNNYPDSPTLSNWPEPMISTIQKYSSLNKRLLHLKRELITAHREKNEYEAQKLWDKL